MGRTSEELKAVVKKSKVEDERYYLVRAKAGQFMAPGWVVCVSSKAWLTPQRIEAYLIYPKQPAKEHPPGANVWYMYPGQKPNPRWGPVCP